jgi:hypothetical protein
MRCRLRTDAGVPGARISRGKPVLPPEGKYQAFGGSRAGSMEAESMGKWMKEALTVGRSGSSPE